MPLFDYECTSCGNVDEHLCLHGSDHNTNICSECGATSKKLPGAASFKIKGLRAANGYGLKFEDSYGVNKVDGTEQGYSFTSKNGTVDHNYGQKGN